MWMTWMSTVAAFAGDPAADAVLDSVLVGGGALVGELALGLPLAAATVAGCGIPLGSEDSSCLETGVVLSLAGYAGGGIGGAALGALPARVRPGRAALGAAIPVAVGGTLLLVGGITEVEPVMFLGVGTLILGAPVGAAIAAATDVEDGHTALPDAVSLSRLSFAPRPGGGQLTVSGRF